LLINKQIEIYLFLDMFFIRSPVIFAGNYDHLMEQNFLFFFLLLVVAVMYSSVGHGGASGYLALMSIFSISTIYFRSSALILNLFVAGIAFLNFRAGYKIRWRLFLPFLLPSIPMAFLGAMIHVSVQSYKILLGIFLMLALLRLLYRPSQEYEVKQPPGILLSSFTGASLGFISGMIGIGGGIILSPILILTKWAGVKETGIYSSLFILLNSLAGLLGLGLGNIELPVGFTYWIIIVTAGGVIGSMTSMKLLPVKYFRYSLALVLLFACYKLLIV
jgi:hypothetical protein